jgi:hypothetical protein
MKKTTIEPGEVELILTRFDKYVAVMAETHTSIPALLAEERHLSGEIGSAAISGSATNGAAAKLGAATARREGEAHRRSAAIQSILDMEADLGHARALVRQRQAALAAEVIQDFSTRWEACSRQQAALRSEASALAAALECEVPTPAPYQIVHSVAHSRAELHPIARAEPVTITLSQELTSIKATSDRLNKAATICSGIVTCREWDSRNHALAVQRGLPLEHTGVYMVRQPFNCPLDGLEFQAGVLVDASVMSQGFLSRLLLTKKLRPIELTREVAA